MKILCTVLVQDNMQKENLCECIRILGGQPTISGSVVCVEFDGKPSEAEKFIQLIEQYPRHSIVTQQ